MSGLNISYSYPAMEVKSGKIEELEKYINFYETPYLLIEIEADKHYPSNKVVLTGIFDGEAQYYNIPDSSFSNKLRSYECCMIENFLSDIGWENFKDAVINDLDNSHKDMIDKIKSAEFPIFDNLEVLVDSVKMDFQKSY